VEGVSPPAIELWGLAHSSPPDAPEWRLIGRAVFQADGAAIITARESRSYREYELRRDGKKVADAALDTQNISAELIITFPNLIQRFLGEMR
jgi:hypothetical protein